MTYSVDYPAGLNEDLERLQAVDSAAHALWLVLVDLIYDNDFIVDELTRNATLQRGPPRFDTGPIGEFLRAGFNVCRIKLLRPDGRPLADQRLLYAVDHRPRIERLYLLGLMERSANYEFHDPIVARSLNDYDRFGIPRIPRG